MQSDSFGSPPNWHMAHVTWFFQKILEKYGKDVDGKLDGKLNMTYLNSYYQRYGIILPKTERGKYPRPTVDDTLRYRKIIEEKIMPFLEKSSIEEDFKCAEIICDIMLGNQHEMQHQELMIYDFQHYFERFLDEQGNYFPSEIERPPVNVEENAQGMMVEIPGGIFELGYSGVEF